MGPRQPIRRLWAFLLPILWLAPASAARAATVVNPTPPQSLAADSSTASTPANPEAEAPPAFAAPSTADSGASQASPVRWMWVVRDALLKPEELPLLVARAKAMGVRGLLVQVVGRGDAWYVSALLPRPEPLAHTQRDPLAELLPLAHAAGLEVHAWMNACLVWSGDRRPRDPRHVVNAHPEWIARMRNGRPMTALSADGRERLGVEGAFLSPAHPRARTHIARVAQEIARRYAVDGIHLDYIRQPGVDIGFDGTSRAQFALQYGVDPARLGALPAERRGAMAKAWAEFQRDNVTAIVQEVGDSVRAVKSDVVLSAAVFADTITAIRRIRQPWMDWLRDGLLDRAFTMSYAASVQTVLSQLSGYAVQLGDLRTRVVPGIAVYNAPLPAAAAKVKGAQALGFDDVAIYSYQTLWNPPDRWARLEGFLQPADPSAVELGSKATVVRGD